MVEVGYGRGRVGSELVQLGSRWFVHACYQFYFRIYLQDLNFGLKVHLLFQNSSLGGNYENNTDFFKSCENIDVEEGGPYVIVSDIKSMSVNL